MTWWKILLIAVSIIVVIAVGVAWYVANFVELDIYVPLYADNCASCHGDELQGTGQGVALVGAALASGDSVAALQKSIRQGHAGVGLPGFTQLNDLQVKGLAIFIGERRLGQTFMNFQFDRDLQVPTGVQHSAAHGFRIETVIDGLDPLIFSIAPLPDGSMLVSEKERGLSIVSSDGVQSALLTGTPETGGSIDILGIQYGSGWLLDVALHPDYVNNGWIYLHYTDLCGQRCDSALPNSMNRVDRGRIVDGRWADVQTVWQAPLAYYAPTPDTGAGGRLAFDGAGHVFFSVGLKSADGTADTTAQDLASPYGKIHRVRDDGSIPADNPFVDTEGALPSIWTYGHRSPQGLEWHEQRQRAWNSEMGPRGGDELNELRPGHNYGWPYFSLGLEYAGTHVERHKLRHPVEEYDASDFEQTLVDITPSPAISSFVIYTGDAFSQWRNDVLIGSLKGSSLFRFVFDGARLSFRETLIKDLARIRDIEVGFDGLIYLLLENKAGSRIVKLVPAE